MKYHPRGKGGQPSLFPRIFFLAFFFAGGVLAGNCFAGHVSDSAMQQLAEYCRQYMQLDSGGIGRTFAATIVLYIRYPLLVVLLGFSSIGMILIPALSVLFGFFVSFSVSCFFAIFGSNGIWPALAAFGIRCAVTLPCFLMLAGPAWENAASLAALSFGRGRRTSAVIYGRSWWVRIGVCLAILLLGVCVDFLCVPWCLQQALEHILI